MLVRRATVEEILPLRHAVLRPGRPVDDARWPGDSEASHWLAEERGAVLGVASAFPSAWEGRSWQLRGMAVDPRLQRGGVGRALLAAIDEVLGADQWCNARESALGFYQRLGWNVVGERFEIPGVGPHFRMVR